MSYSVLTTYLDNKPPQLPSLFSVHSSLAPTSTILRNSDTRWLADMMSPIHLCSAMYARGWFRDPVKFSANSASDLARSIRDQTLII